MSERLGSITRPKMVPWGGAWEVEREPVKYCSWRYDSDTDSYDTDCGEKIVWESYGLPKFCHGCGKPVREPARIETSKSGTTHWRKCSHCGCSVDLGDLFCRHCGDKFSEEVEP